ncbi:MAG TPA: hypothetical protein VMV43_03740, partial [Candidatus Nanopelagicaceae bacterium]|nr:hypothetical protein [Candidatus Nanopelagicaceae bacterium]
TSGQLSFNQINVELGNASGSQASLRAMSVEAGKTVVNASVSAFYGYSAADDILISWSTSYSPNPLTSTTIGLVREIALAGQSAGTTLRTYIGLQISSQTGTVTTGVQWSTTSSSSGFSGNVIQRTGTGTTYAYIPVSPSYVSGAQTLYIRQYIVKSLAINSVSGNVIITSTYQPGAGTVNSYATSGTVTWGVSF